MRTGILTAIALVNLLAPEAAEAQEATPPSPIEIREDFLTRAAATAERYRDRREAIADGFRSLGPDFPGMGVHWVQIGRIVAGELDAERPSVLCYIEIDGRPELVGLAYTLPLRSDETPPAEPFGVDVWHDHSGEVSEESLLLSHPSSASATRADFRLSMVHVWRPEENPAGDLRQNNWRLPFLRAGLATEGPPSSAGARGLSLGASGIDYYRELFRWAVNRDPSAVEVIGQSLERWGGEVDTWLEQRSAGPVTHLEMRELGRFWNELWRELEEGLAPAHFERILPLRDDHGG